MSDTRDDHGLSDFVVFVALAYALTWVLLAPWFYSYTRVWHGNLPRWVWFILPLIFLGGWAPSIAALTVTARREGWQGAKALLRSILQWRVAVGWYVFALGVPILAVCAAVPFTELRASMFHGFSVKAALASVPLAYATALPFGPLGEELGWRGYALPWLLRRWGPWTASLILGVLWTFWHLPMMLLFPGAALPDYLPLTTLTILLYTAELTAVTCIMTFLLGRTGGSVLMAVLFHLAFNTARTVVLAGMPQPTPGQLQQVFVANIAVLWVIAVVTLGFLDRRRARSPFGDAASVRSGFTPPAA
jgi:uncharacterized protein